VAAAATWLLLGVLEPAQRVSSGSSATVTNSSER
jgi:hypothetical protein